MSSSDSPPSALHSTLERLQQVRSSDNIAQQDALEEFLALGREYLGVDNGHVKRIDMEDQTHEVIASDGGEGVRTGAVHNHGSTYCRFTVDRNMAFTVTHASEQGYAEDPAYREHELECYIGAPFSVGGTLYGTVCFVSADPRPTEFSPDEQAFVELVARAVSREMTTDRPTEETRVKNRAIEDASVAISVGDATESPASFVYVNKQFEQLTGYDRETLHGADFTALRGPDTSAEKLRTFRDRLDNDSTHTDEICLYRQDGTPFWALLSTTPVTDERGRTTHYIGFYQNVTQRHQHERLLAVLNRVLRHNLRNELTVLGGFVNTLARRADATDSTEMDKISSALTELKSLSYTAKQLERCRQETEQVGSLDVVPLVADLAADLRADPAIGTVTVSTPDSQAIAGTEHVEQALEELGDNLRRHTADDVAVELAVEPLPDSQYVRIVVSDDGPGLAETERLTLEGRPETSLVHGSGLGLFLVYWVISTHGGHITVSTDEGTTVELYLRGSPEPPSHLPRTEQSGDE